MEKGVWFQVKKGIRGLVVEDAGSPTGLLTRTCSALMRDYAVMMKSDRLPVLIGQVVQDGRMHGSLDLPVRLRRSKSLWATSTSDAAEATTGGTDEATAVGGNA